jgi:hypothetical protein
MAGGESEVCFIVNRLVAWRGQDGIGIGMTRTANGLQVGDLCVEQADHKLSFYTVWL